MGRLAALRPSLPLPLLLLPPLLLLLAAAPRAARAAPAAGSPSSFGVGRSQIVVSSAAETELLAHNVTPGVTVAMVDFFWLTGDPLPSGRAGVDVMVWRFYVDGEASASVAVSSAQAAFVGDADPAAPWSNDYFGKNSKFGGWHVNVPIPFYRSIRVTLQLPAWWPAPSERIFAMCRGVEGVQPRVGAFTLPLGARLVASAANASLAPLDFHTLVSVPAGTSGLFLGSMIDIRMYGAGAGSLNTLEGCWHFHSPPSTPFPGSFLLGTGAEDYPESAYYFNAGPYRSATAGLTVFSPSAELSLVSFFKLHSRDLVLFNDGMAFIWRNGDITGPDGEKCTALTGNPIGTPSRANVSTLAYVYTW